MATKIVESIARETKVLNTFIAWYKKSNYNIDIKTFFLFPFEFQCGVFLKFFEEEYNYGITAERYCYVIVYPDLEKAKDIILNRPGRVVKDGIDNVEFADFNSNMLSTLYNYERGMIKIIELIINPFLICLYINVGYLLHVIV